MKKANVLIIIFIAIVLLVLTVVLLACTVFVVRHVQVESAVASSLINEEAIITSGDISIGRSIITVNKDKVTASIEKDHPYVKVTFVERKFPNTIVINVTTRFAIMYIVSQDGSTVALLDSELKVLETRPSSVAEDLQLTVVEGVKFDIPEDGIGALVGTFLDREENEKFRLLSEIAQASGDKNLDLGDASFKTFFKGIAFVSYDRGYYVYIKTNTGVTFVLDTSLSTTMYQQLSLCKYFYDSTEVDINKTSGYIALDKNSDKVAYKWVESID